MPLGDLGKGHPGRGDTSAKARSGVWVLAFPLREMGITGGFRAGSWCELTGLSQGHSGRCGERTLVEQKGGDLGAFVVSERELRAV